MSVSDPNFSDEVGTMKYFIGVVEDRNDPNQTGRVRVRIFGDHTEDPSVLPTQDLPWAQVMMPVTSASSGGVGRSATGIAQGSWVVGIYLDGDSKQSPLVMGTLPSAAPARSTSGTFTAPTTGMTQRTGISDQPRGARGDTYRESPAYINRMDMRSTGIHTSIAPQTSSISVDEPDAYYERSTWELPLPAGGREPSYPYNDVEETEAGHVFEVDNTPGNERIMQYHASGTFEEVHADGSKVVTVTGSNYTVTFENDNMYVKGDVNLTVDGDMRQLVKGNYHLEVIGNKTELVRSSRTSKIINNENLEVLQDFASNVTGDYLRRIGGEETRVVSGLRNVSIGANDDLMVAGDLSQIVVGKINIFSGDGHATTSMGTLTVTSQGNITVATPANKSETVNGNSEYTIKGNQTETITGNQTSTISGGQTNAVTGTKTETAGTGDITYGAGEITVNGITHTQHTHPYESGTDPEGDGPPVG